MCSDILLLYRWKVRQIYEGDLQIQLWDEKKLLTDLKHEANYVQQDFTGHDKEDWQFKLPIQMKGGKH